MALMYSLTSKGQQMKKEVLDDSKIDKSWWPEGKKPYLLPSQNRVEMLTETQVRVRNFHRLKSAYDTKWTFYPKVVRADVYIPRRDLPKDTPGREYLNNAPPIERFEEKMEWWVWAGDDRNAISCGKWLAHTAEGAIKKFLKTAKGEWLKKTYFAISLHEYAERARRIQHEHNVTQQLKESQTMGKKVKAEATEKKATSKKESTSERPKWNDHGMCDLIRWCGSKDYSKAQTAAVLKHAGFAPSPTTIFIQLKNGRDGKNVPTLKRDEEKELIGVAKNVKEEKSEKAPKKDKKEKKKDKKKKSSKEKAKADAEADAEAEDEEEPAEDEEAEEETAEEDDED